MTKKIHFLYEGPVDLDAVRNWDPEKDPMRFPDGVGHGFFQNFLAVRGLHPETVISKTTGKADIYVVYQKKRYSYRNNLAVYWEMMRRKSPPQIVSIHSDAPLESLPVFFVSRSVVPNLFRLTEANDRFIPLLPQNGLIKSNGNRKTVAVYGGRKTGPIIS
nr:hypothetical protein [Marinicella sp. W31]MDC2879321.1 hypothetical protein [Marinicella sp. W31]